MSGTRTRETKRAIEDLRIATEQLHKCRAAHRKSVSIRQEFQEQVAWKGTVEDFRVDHPETDTCYAWSAPIEGSDRRKFYAVLKIPPVETAADAVRAAIVSDYRNDC